MKRQLVVWAMAGAFLGAFPGCADDDDDHGDGNEEEVISSVIVSFTPAAGGAALVFEFDDPDGDGGDAPVIDDVELAADTDYVLTVAFENRLEDPAEDITEEVEDEGDEHQVFLLGSAVNGPAAATTDAPLTHTYGDQDMGGLPLGLVNDISTVAGSGELNVVLQHLPPEGGVVSKVDMLAEGIADEGLGSLPGDSDVNVVFKVEVQ